MSRWIQGVSPANSLMNHAPVLAPPPLPLPVLRMSAMLLLIISLVFVVHGHRPHFFAGGFGAFEELVEILARRAERADVDVGQRHFDRAGERGGVDQVRAAELLGVGTRRRRGSGGLRRRC